MLPGAWFLPFVLQLVAAHDPDAGLAVSLTKTAIATVTASSNADQAYLTVDGDETTHWTSRGCIPGFYLPNQASNILKDVCAKGFCRDVNANRHSGIALITDGMTNTSTHWTVATDQGQSASLFIDLPTPQVVEYVTVRGYYNSKTFVKLYDETSVVQVFALTELDKYKTIDLKASGKRVTKLQVEFSKDLTLWEIAVLGEKGCVDTITWDLGTVADIGVVKSRHWAGHPGLWTELSTSVDGLVWAHATRLDPGALSSVRTVFGSGVRGRYIRVEHRYSTQDYAKVYMWELDAYDVHGDFGPAPVPRPNPVTLRDMLGVNGIWGWGSSRYSEHETLGTGPTLYNSVATHGRNYHNMDWDVTDPDVSANYSVKMASGQGTQAKWWLDWDKEYQEWVEANLTVHVSLQFTAAMFPQAVWNSPASSALRYGREFARHFGPSRGTVKVKAAEVGNEPWDYDASFYKEVLVNMAAGLKSGDPGILVMPGAFQADNKDDVHNYIGTRVTSDSEPFIDVINFHHYSYTTRSDGVRIATYPENPVSSFNSIRNMIRWRDVNMPEKPLWVTEWGWDSDGAGETCRFSECVSEDAAATYAKRGLLLHARYGVQRSTWFFYGNLDSCDNHVYCRSGLTGTANTAFTKKKTFTALQNFLTILGDSQFIDVIREDENAYVYTFGSTNAGITSGGHVTTHIVAWQPVEKGGNSTVGPATISFVHNSKLVYVFCDDQDDNTGSMTPCNGRVRVDPAMGRWTVEISPDPIVIQVDRASLGPIVG